MSINLHFNEYHTHTFKHLYIQYLVLKNSN